MDMSNMVLLAKEQTAKGVPAAPVPGTNAILCKGLTPSLIKGKFVERNLIRGAKGNYGGIFVGEHREFDFEVELAGSGAAGTAPKFAPLLLGCDMSETITAGVSAVYQPIAGSGSFMTLFGYMDGVLFKMIDAKGTWSLTTNSEDVPVIKFKFTGTYEKLLDATFPTGIVFTGFVKPVSVSAVNTPVFTMDGLSLVVKSFGLDLANQVAWRDWVGDASARSPDRKPTASGVFEMTNVATKDWAEDVRLGTEMPLALTHGTVAGNIVEIAAPKLQFNAEPSISDDGKTAMLNGSFAVMPNLGNDEVVLTFR